MPLLLLYKERYILKVTIEKVLQIVDETKDAADFSKSVKVYWLSEAEALVIDRVISKYEGYDEKDYNCAYDENTPTDTELVAPMPYARLYEYYLKAQIDYARDEIELYHNDLAQFESALSEFWRYYNRTHRRKNVKIRV